MIGQVGFKIRARGPNSRGVVFAKSPDWIDK